MRVIVCIPVWKRHKIFEKVLIRLNEIRQWSKNEIIIYCAGEFTDECHSVFLDHKKKHDKYLSRVNRPVSNKFNYLFQNLKNIDFDYATIVGSDDLVSDEGWQIMENAMNEYKYHFIAFKDVNFFDSKTKTASYYEFRGRTQNRSVGCYRFLHENLVKSLDYTPFRDGMDSGIDWTMEQKLEYYQNIEKKIISLGNKGHIVDVKSGTNINSYNKLKVIMNKSDVSLFPTEIQRILKLNT